ncbi:MAG: sialate O-acetylesterase [Cyanobacteria bacterium P01_D01_bin.56]
MPVGYFSLKPGSEDTGSEDSVENKLPVYTENDAFIVPVIGQSWAAGRLQGDDAWSLGAFGQDTQYRKAQLWVKPDQVLTDNGDWEFFNETNFNWVFPGVGSNLRRPPIIQMATALEALAPESDIYFVAYALGGTGVARADEWAVGGDLRRLYIEYYLRPALTSLGTVENRTFHVLPVTTLFGARDGETVAEANAYADRLLNNSDSLINEIRAEFSLPSLTAGVFRLRSTWASRVPEFDLIDAQVDSMAANSTIMVMAADEYTDGNDALHFDGKGTRELGNDVVFRSMQRELSIYEVPLTFLSALISGVTGEAGQLIVLSFNQPLDSSIVPAFGDFSLVGGVSVSAIAFPSEAANTITLTPTTPYQSDDTVTFSYTPGVNPITNTDGDTAAALTNAPISNTLQASAGITLTFTDRTANTGETDGVYTSDTGGGSYRWVFVADQSIPANTDGSVEFDPGETESIIGFDVDNTNQRFNTDEGYNFILFVAGLNYVHREGSSGPTTDSGVAYTAGDYMRLRREGTAIVAEKSSDNKLTWDLITTQSIPALATAEIFIKINLAAVGQSFSDVILRV